MDLWNEAFADLAAIERDDKAPDIDRRLQIAQIRALLAIGQQLSEIRHLGINPKFDTD
ncbi:MAG: hypothetical protein ACR2KJ_11245 [Jatrophihabitans sp.]